MTPRRFALATLAGVMVLQALWIVTVPPFRGIDEFDHVFRVAGVAAGDWRLDEPAPHGRGLVVEVPNEVVEAAQAQCANLEYTGVDNCYAMGTSREGRVEVATAAGEYHPLYYALVGGLASGFEGVAYDYALRALSALLCLLGIAVAAFVWAWGGATRVERFGFVMCLTPILVYSTSVPAPNGLEMVMGLLVWSSLLRLGSGDRRHDRVLLLVAALAGCVLVTVRYLGPVWLGLTVLTVLLFLGWRVVRDVVLASPMLVALLSVLVVAATAASVAWTMGAGFVSTQEGALGSHPDVALGAQPAVWLLQVVAAFPLRGDASHPFVYVVYLVLIIVILLTGLVAGGNRRRLALALAVLTVIGLPVVLTLATMDTHGIIWQGRYGLAYSVGLPLMASVMATRLSTSRWRAEASRLVLLASVMIGCAHAVAMAVFLQGEQQVRPSVDDPAWVNPPVPVVAAVGLLAWGLLGAASAARLGSEAVAPQAGQDPRPAEGAGHQQSGVHPRRGS